jgi:hypothetical protein
MLDAKSRDACFADCTDSRSCKQQRASQELDAKRSTRHLYPQRSASAMRLLRCKYGATDPCKTQRPCARDDRPHTLMHVSSVPSQMSITNTCITHIVTSTTTPHLLSAVYLNLCYCTSLTSITRSARRHVPTVRRPLLREDLLLLRTPSPLPSLWENLLRRALDPLCPS